MFLTVVFVSFVHVMLSSVTRGWCQTRHPRNRDLILLSNANVQILIEIWVITPVLGTTL